MADNWVAVAAMGDLTEGAMVGVDAGDKQIAVYNVAGEFYATDNVCTHAYAMLTDGFLDGDIIECPLHGGAFCVKNGQGQGAPLAVPGHAGRDESGVEWSGPLPEGRKESSGVGGRCLSTAPG